MRKDDRTLLGFSAVAAGIAVVALTLAGGAASLSARTSPRGSRAEAARTSTGAAQAGGAQEKQPNAQETAGQFYMNVQVLKDIPSDQLIPAMRYITGALGVECEYCHVRGHFDSDDKHHKVTARKMMQMMFAIDKDNFNGRREVTCYTCHRGAAHPVGVPVLTAEMAGASMMGHSGMMGSGSGMGMEKPAQGAAASTAPPLSADAILAKYTQALGGEAAIQKITTLEEKGTISAPARPGMTAQVEEVRKAPDKALVTIRMANGRGMERGYNGTIGWESFPGRGAEDLTWDDLARARQWAAFIPGLNMKQDFVREQPVGTEKVGDQEAYKLMAFRKGGGRVIFDFDVQTGLLLRVSQRIESPLGALPENIDYSDYREVNGVKLPFTVTVTHVQGPTVYKWDSIQANVPVEDARFEKPAQKAAPAQN